MKPAAIWKLCPGYDHTNPAAHSMRDFCWNCAPYWTMYPSCSRDGNMLERSGYCKKCRKYSVIGKRPETSDLVAEYERDVAQQREKFLNTIAIAQGK